MDELVGRKIPYSASAEQAVIGSMLIDSRCIPDVIEKVKAEDFYLKSNRDVFETIYQMFAYAQTIDPVTVVDQMKVRWVYCEHFCAVWAIPPVRSVRWSMRDPGKRMPFWKRQNGRSICFGRAEMSAACCRFLL